ncbi:Uma2 family endonuclease [Trichocoleus sp. DQ-A3]|uniref:Uma2 family endonuclease n=1 Tax=Cyanophyceae TaxID=3028117 RepID=UPI001682D088|nr:MULTISPECIES: Uma2 family endonuclease [unclassified Coleofasciculus]MBD1889441.1 Uma2 family endonuclease [Coleofasciculus sp. FACHB-SPT9]MBD1899881.1 Uma2 family endonuclease [Coleofasciculus sp. FACHB-125]MBD2539497.1 Uma2 family endonuclease [Coleofasciculus sp. FACHB-SPT36]
MVGTGTKLTLQDFLALPEGDVIYEFIDGQVVPKVSPKYFHSTVQFALMVLIRAWCKGRGRVVQEWAVLLKRNGQDWAPVPDVTYISYERLPASWKRNEACPVAPELAIEIISPDQTIKEFEDKAKDYFDTGVLRVWIVDPEAISIRVFSPDKTSQLYTDSAPIIDSLFPGLEITPKQVFEEAEVL